MYSEYCMKDCLLHTKYPFYSVDKFICSFDISNRFTCVPLQKTIDICSDALFRSHLSPPESVFIEFIIFATISVEFIFDNMM